MQRINQVRLTQRNLTKTNPSKKNNVGNEKISFHDPASEVQKQIANISDAKLPEIKEAEVTIDGKVIKQFRICYLICTIIFGFIFIFPFLFFLCDWWKKAVYSIYNVDEKEYRSLKKLMKFPKLKYLKLQVTDNFFNDDKAEVLNDFLSKSSLESFRFVNRAKPFNVNADEFSGFEERMQGFKSLKIDIDIKWPRGIFC